ncbi:hypothetical protein JCM9957A_61240 [Kineosporia succinea]
MHRVGEEEGEKGSGHCCGKTDTQEHKRQGHVLAHTVKHEDLKDRRGRTEDAVNCRPAVSCVSNGIQAESVTPNRVTFRRRGLLRLPISGAGPPWEGTECP